jgi:preprotein translocase subunit SecG
MISRMTLQGFYNFMYQIMIILAVITFGLSFFHLWTSEDESKE